MEVPILKQGQFLIATIQAALSDNDLEQLRVALVHQVVDPASAGKAQPSRIWLPA